MRRRSLRARCSRTPLLLALVLALAGVARVATLEADSRDLHRILAAEIGTSDFDLLSLPLGAGTPDALDVTIDLDGAPARLVLEQRSLRAADFRLLVQTASGEIEQREAPVPSTYRGRVAEDATSRVAARLDGDGALFAWIRRGDRFDTLLPARELRPGLPPDLHVIVREEELPSPPAGTCATEDPLVPPALDAPPPAFEGAGGPRKLADVAFDCDFEFFQQNGGNVANVVRDVETVMNGVEMIYETDLGISYEITVILVRTAEPDPYTTVVACDLLDELRQHWNGNLGAIRRDAAHLMTGKDLQAGSIGIARVATICNKSGSYGLSQSRFSPMLGARIALTAHELGHNWSAVHCQGGDCRIMCPAIGGCSGDMGAFGAASRAAIVTFRDSRPCLDDLLPALDPPFFDPFASGSLDPSLWSYVEGAKTSSAGGPKPSEPRALNLDASGGAPFKDDEIRSNEIRLAGLPAAYVAWFTNHSGVEAGERLAVEYYSLLRRWEELETIVSDGTDPAFYRFRGFRLPLFAIHDEFRIRFRAEVDQKNDDWFVDDVRITASPVSIEMIGEATQIRPGQAAVFRVRVENLTSAHQPIQTWLDAFRADGKPFNGNPVLGPRSLVLAPRRIIEKRAHLRIPDTTPPSGPHLLRAAVGGFPVPIALSTLEVTIVP